MHELSIIQSIIESVTDVVAAEKKPAIVEAIDLDIGELAGIEIDSIEFLWDAAVEGTVLSGAERRIRRVAGRALCSACQKEFTLHHLFDACPHCGQYLKNILSGEEMLIRSLTLKDQ